MCAPPGCLPAQPGVLDDVVGIGEGAEHPVGQAADPGPGRLEWILAHVADVAGKGKAWTARSAAAWPLARAASAMRPVSPVASTVGRLPSPPRAAVGAAPATTIRARKRLVTTSSSRTPARARW